MDIASSRVPEEGPVNAVGAEASQIASMAAKAMNQLIAGDITAASAAAPSPSTLGAGTLYGSAGGNPATILPMLNRALAGISSKSTSTPSGRLYDTLLKFLTRHNRELTTNPVVVLDMARNPKIIDAREGSVFAAYVAPEPDIEIVVDPSAVPSETTPDRIYGE
jgi:hypothetical protein